MSNQKAYSYPIIPKNSSPDETALPDGKGAHLVHQSSPTWVLTFVRWQFRDTLRTQTATPNEVRRPLVVENDCIQASVSYDKGSLTPSCQLTLVETDVNYETQVEPGDFVFVNMLNWERNSRRVADAARAISPINGAEDGFKGLFKVQSVRKYIQTEPSTGVKTLLYHIDGYAFTEFNNTLYFNPNLINAKNLQNVGLYIADVASMWSNLISVRGQPYVQEIIASLIQGFIGTATNSKHTVGGLIISNNTHFSMPTIVGRFLGVTKSDHPHAIDYKTVTAAKDIYRYVFGIQQYASGGHLTMAHGMNPTGLYFKYPGFEYTQTPCPGNTLLKTEYWNQVKLWSVLNEYTNSPLNELYTCFKINPQGRVMPTVIFRQIPFTSEDFVKQKLGNPADATSSSIKVTKFLNLPRWKVDPAFILSMDIGRDEAARINFVQYYAKSAYNDKGVEISAETASGNYIFDQDDIQRSGLRPYVVQNQFNDSPDALVKFALIWARILGDALIGGHLKMNGTFNCIGITEPIAVGDNLEVDHVVYHIEGIVHNCSINVSTGVKSFRTIIKASHGVSVNSNAKGTKYAEMTFTNGYADRANDFNHQQILPGVSESQDVVYRPANLDPSKQATSASHINPFPQPSTTKNNPKKGS